MTNKACSRVLLALLLTALSETCLNFVCAFGWDARLTTRGLLRRQIQRHGVNKNTYTRNLPSVYAGGFEWQDPDEFANADVENPFAKHGNKNKSDLDKVDAARLLSPRLQGSNLYFVGMMGSGKTTVGDVVARRMGTYNFLDTDSIIESAAGKKIPEIFKEAGEEGFRDIESQVLGQLHAYVRCVISTGGGVVCRPSNWAKLQTGIVVFLDADPEHIMKRIKGTDRPLLQTDNPLETLKSLLDSRRSLYEQADVRVEVKEGMSEQDVADAVVHAVHDLIDKNPPAWKKAQAVAMEDDA